MIMSGSAPVPYNSVCVLMPSILGGGEVIPDALVASTPRMGVGVVAVLTSVEIGMTVGVGVRNDVQVAVGDGVGGGSAVGLGLGVEVGVDMSVGLGDEVALGGGVGP